MKKILFAVLFLALLFIGSWFGLKMFIVNNGALSKTVIAELKQATGREVLIDTESADFKLFPSPQVTYRNFSIGNIEGASSPYVLGATKITLKLSLADLFAAEVRPSQIILDGVTLDLETLPSGKQSWVFAAKEAGKNNFHGYFSKIPVVVSQGLVRYSSARHSLQSELKNVNGRISYSEDGKIISFDGNASVLGQNSNILLQVSAADFSAAQAQIPLQLMVTSGGVKYTTRGMLSSTNSTPEYKGDLQAGATTFEEILGNVLSIPVEAVPANSDTNILASGKLTATTNHVAIEGLKIKAIENKNTLASGVVDVDYMFGKVPYISLAAKMDEADVNRFYKTAQWILALPESKNADRKKTKQHFSGMVDVNIRKASYNQQPIENARLSMTVDNGVYTINEMTFKAPGNTRASLFGVAGEDEDGKATFNGNMELQGMQLEQFVALGAVKGADISALNMGRFILRSNVALSPDQLRFSEMQARIEEMGFAGAIILHREDRLRLESFLRIMNVNFDKFLQLANVFKDKEESSIKKDDKSLNETFLNRKFNWLAALPLDISSDFLLENFVLFERKGDRARFQLNAGLSRLALNKVDAVFNGARLAGNFSLKTEADKNPYMDLDLQATEIDLADIFPFLNHIQNDDEKALFLEQPLDMMFLKTYRGHVKAQIGTLSMRQYQFKNTNLEVKLDNNQFDVLRFDSNFWDGAMQVSASLQAGAIPSFSLSFILSNSNLVELAQTTPFLKYAAGRMSLQGKVGTSGVALKSWLKNASGAVSVNSKNVSFQGFGMASLARSVSIARSVSDIVNAKRLALDGGITQMRDFNGQLNFTNGTVQITQLPFASDDATGAVSGSVNLLNDTLDLNLDFALLSTQDPGKTPPNIRLNLQGDIDHIQKELATQELEAYVARDAAARVLGN